MQLRKKTIAKYRGHLSSAVRRARLMRRANRLDILGILNTAMFKVNREAVDETLKDYGRTISRHLNKPSGLLRAFKRKAA